MTRKQWKDIRYFTSDEFDSPDLPGSGRVMNRKFMMKLDQARHIAGIQAKKEGMKIVFNITSGVRTAEHNKAVGGVSDSSHLKAIACDIVVRNGKERRIILNSLIKVGLDRRIGLGETFIHVDDDAEKVASYWTYGSKPKKKGVVSYIKNVFK